VTNIKPWYILATGAVLATGIGWVVLSGDDAGDAIGAAGSTATTAAPATTSGESTTTTTTTTTTTSAPKVPTTAEIQSASLLFSWPVDFTKTAVITSVPDWGTVEVGRRYSVDIEVEGICDNVNNCIQQSIPHVASPAIQQTPSETLELSDWTMSGDRWTNTMIGYHVSASYGDSGTCVYEWIEEWDIVITNAVSNGDSWLATEFEGAMRRTQRVEPGRSALAIANGYCAATDWNQVGDWDVHAIRNMAPTA